MTMNILYPQTIDSTDAGYWFLELPHDIGSQKVPRLERDIPLEANFRNFTFNGSGLNNLVVFYKPGTGRCLWVLSSDDIDNFDLPELTRQALPSSNLERIEPNPIDENYPSVDLFGEEPTHTWCYYFQKADLARQLGEWMEVTRLGDEAESLGFEPADANEWLPFILGYAHSENWNKALDRTYRAI